jgi:hypothetical protein
MTMCDEWNTQEYYEQLTDWTQDRADEQLYQVYLSIYTIDVYDLISWNIARILSVYLYDRCL